jgi:hypothetical protein
MAPATSGSRKLPLTGAASLRITARTTARRPTLELHTTLASAFSRATSAPDKVTFDYKPSPSSIDFCIIQALALIYIVRKVVIRTFSLPLEAEMDRFENAFLKAWAKEAS